MEQTQDKTIVKTNTIVIAIAVVSFIIIAIAKNIA